jgi:hypothetical protein
MEDQHSRPVSHQVPPTAIPPVGSPKSVATAATNAAPKPALGDGEAQAILAINHLQAPTHTKAKLPTKLLIICAALILLVIVTDFLLGTMKSKNNTGSSVGLPSQSAPAGGNSTTNQINQDVQSCSNAVNAATVC